MVNQASSAHAQSRVTAGGGIYALSILVGVRTRNPLRNQTTYQGHGLAMPTRLKFVVRTLKHMKREIITNLTHILL